MQYAALILRTADLLHITSDRTPSTMFKLIAPTDPTSQQEWAKQSAVTSVRSKATVDADGNVDLEAPRDTIEVFAKFNDENGFFGLSAYLAYATRQLTQSYEWGEEAEKRYGSRFHFSWRRIDESHIETEGFLRETYAFTFDQDRVLDLLTGHTLYNNTAVVIRELVQNSLDAIRLQAITSSADWHGCVTVTWSSSDRKLTVTDNGTGMTQEIIERNLLRVGASRYQEPEFTEKFPNFSSISRFGIGVLSTFMIADSVVITTSHADEAQARRLSLRSVHGRYLIRLLDKGSGLSARVAPHGTSFELTLRPSADLGNVEQILKQWVVVPRCEVTLLTDDNPPVPVGYESPSDALKDWLRAEGFTPIQAGEESEPANGAVRVVQVADGGLEMAWAARWSAHFKEKGCPSWCSEECGLCAGAQA